MPQPILKKPGRPRKGPPILVVQRVETKSPAVFRQTLSPVGTRVGVRQLTNG